jgi:predicted phosphodiesterase
MRVAALYDVHGNLPALDAVLRDVEREGVDVVVVGGDVAAGPMPVESLDRLRALGDGALFLAGNAERELTDLRSELDDELGRARLAWLREQLGPERLEFMRSMPPNVRVVVDGVGPTLFCHGSPRSDLEVLTADTPDDRLRDAIAGADASVVVCGHTHSQWIRELDGVTVANAGSVGLPYEDRPGAYWALIADGVHDRRTEYDVEAAAWLYEATGFPEAKEYARETLLEPESRQAAVEFFEQLARERPEFAGRGA